MLKSLHRTLLVTSTVIAGLSAIPASAQEGPGTAPVQPAAPDTPQADAQTSAENQPGGDVVVTGSRILSPNLTSPSPVTVVDQQQIRLQGATRLEDVLNNLPQAFATQSSSVSNGSTGTATLNLRNIGQQRTLVLVNGRRLMPGDPNSVAAAPDVNTIPAALIKRIDVLTGGASSVYGSDAVAGVVNFVLDTEFTGVSVDTNYGFYNHNNNNKRWQALSRSFGYPAPSGLTNDGQQFDVNLKIGAGTEDGRGHVVGYLGYRNIKAVDQGSRDYSSCGINASASGYVCGGSATAFPANFTLGDAVVGGAPSGLPQQYTLGPDGTLITGRTLYNANPLNYYQRPDRRYTAGFLAHYDVSDAFKPYAEFNFMDDRSVAQIAPSGNFSNTTILNCDNPFLSPLQQSTFCRPTNLVTDGNGAPLLITNPDGTTANQGNVLIGRRNVEGGGRQADFRHTGYRFVAGAKGDITRGINYDVYGQYGATNYNQIYRNEFSVSRTQRALDVLTDTRPGSATLGQPVCRSVINGTDPNCVPLNIFGAASITPEALNYVQIAGLMQGETRQKIVSGSLTFAGSEYGFASPWAEDGIALNIGAEYREESLDLEVDTSFATGDLAGQGGPTLPVSGSYNVKEAFAELSLPIASDRPFLYELSLNAGYRYSDYSTSGGVSSYKAQGVWAPIRDIKFRGGYNRAVRAPNVQELFVAQSVQIDGATDPCAGTTPTFSPEQCVRLGVPTNLYGLIANNPSEQYNGLVGGNPNLKPEKADTYTVGVLLQPGFLPGFNLSIDAFSIKVKDIIGIIGADTILAQCGVTGDPALCGAINRDANGTLWQTPQGYVVDTRVNAGTLKTRGIDVTGAYAYRTDTAGTFSLSFSGTYVDEFSSSKVGAEFDCAGYYGAQCLYPQAKWRHQARLTWQGPSGIGISGQWRYLSATKFERTSSDSDLAGAFNPLDARVPSQSYFDLAMTARVGDNYTMRLGANNLLDREPPVLSATAAPIGSFGNGNTYPGIYEANGRYVFVGLTIDM
jgi:outer membrane receptor protein involved in Fe transport